MARIVVFVYAVLAGVAIAIGGTTFLSTDNKVLGAAFFAIGLYSVLTLGLNLFTGKVCYVFDKDKNYAIDVAIIWLGNLVGACLFGLAICATRVSPALIEKATTIVDAKLADGLVSIFILAIFCNIMIYIPVENYLRNSHEVGKYVGIFLGIIVFILCGFEHCIANMYYFTIAGAWSAKAVLYLLVMTAGNAIGGFIFPLCRKFKDYAENLQKEPEAEVAVAVKPKKKLATEKLSKV